MAHTHAITVSFADFARRQVGPSSTDPDQGLRHSEELQRLQRLLHFPEEVALQLTETEYDLFNKVPPMHYVRQVTIDLAREAGAPATKPSVQALIQRFNEVLYKLSQLLKCSRITQLTHKYHVGMLAIEITYGLCIMNQFPDGYVTFDGTK